MPWVIDREHPGGGQRQGKQRDSRAGPQSPGCDRRRCMAFDPGLSVVGCRERNELGVKRTTRVLAISGGEGHVEGIGRLDIHEGFFGDLSCEGFLGIDCEGFSGCNSRRPCDWRIFATAGEGFVRPSCLGDRRGMRDFSIAIGRWIP